MSNRPQESDEDSTVSVSQDEIHAFNKTANKILDKVTSLETVVALQGQRLAMVERLIYGGAGLALTSVAIGILALVIRKP